MVAGACLAIQLLAGGSYGRDDSCVVETDPVGS